MTHSIFKRTLGLAVLVLVLLPAAFCWAEGMLTLIARTDEGRLKMVLNEEKGEIIGMAREGWAVLHSLEAYHEDKDFTIIVGNEVFVLERWDLGRFKTYGGVIQDDRGISAQAESIGSHLTIMGTIENEMNGLVDFAVRANYEKGTFELAWEKNLLFLKKISAKDGGGPGRCQGGLIKMDSQQLGRFWCKSSGTLEDAFFNNPDHILAWIVMPFVK